MKARYLFLVVLFFPCEIFPSFGFSLDQYLSSTVINPVVSVSRNESSPKKSDAKSYGIDIKDISSKKKDAINFDLHISSTVPVNLSVQDDKLVVEQIRDTKMLTSNKVSSTADGRLISVDMSKIGTTKNVSCYKVPMWPISASCFNKKDKVDVQLSFEHAGNAFSSSGHTQDLSRLIFGECKMYVRDILLVSKLVENGEVIDYSNCESTGGYLAGVAGQELCFNAETDDFRLLLSYVRHFKDDDVSLGILVPFVWQKHSLTLTTSLSQMAQENEAFRSRYGDDFNAFVADILKKKGSFLTQDDEERGIGDIEVFLNYNIPCRHFDRLLAGVKVLFPTARERNVHKLWEPELGNGGFPEISLYGSGLWSKNRFLNVHFLLQGTYGLSAEVLRRIPSCKENSVLCDGSFCSLGETLAMGELVRISAEGSFRSIDTVFRRFATETERVCIHRGSSGMIEFGNLFEKFVFERGFFDIFYMFRIKGSDYISDYLLDEKFRPEILKCNTYQVEHRAGAAYSYHFDEFVRAMVGAQYSFAGRNIPKNFSVDARISIEF